MKRLLKMLIVLSVFYIGIQIGFKYLGYGHNVSYQIETDNQVFYIDEKYTSNRKNENNNYYFNVKINDSTFTFQTYEKFNHSDRIIKKIRYYKDEQYECILPVFENNKIIFDLMCMRDNQITYYHDLIGQNSNLDSFVNTIKDEIYTLKNWEDDRSDPIIEASITVYPNNILDRHFVGINNYRGVYTINNLNLKKIVNVEIFSKDVYERKISSIVDKYYVTADYSQTIEFNSFYVVDLTSNNVKTITSTNKISFNSYVQGTLNNLLYVFDRDNKKQYEINVKSNKVIEIGNENIGIKVYENGKWSTLEMSEAIKQDILFRNNNETTSDAIYERIDKVGNVLSGYYYYYQKVGNVYKVYRSNVQNPELKTYLFTVSQINSINYVSDYVYYTENNEVKYYHDKTGVKTLFRNEEFEFNKSLYYNVYLKK